MKTDWSQVGKNPIKVANLMATRNYDMFRFLDGNRETRHYKKLVKSMTEIGILYQPILVNENYEIVEGQGRFLAMKELNLPVLYVVQSGIGIEECRFLNSSSTNWNIKNYVHSYAQGSDRKIAYQYLEQLEKEFPDFGIRIIYNAASNKPVNGGGKGTENLKSGEAELSEDDYNRGRAVLAYLEQFMFLFKAMTGRAESMQNALIYCYNNPAVDNEYLREKVEKYYGTIPPIANVTQAVSELERIYNFNIRGNREQVFLKSDYERYAKQIIKKKR